MEAHIVNLARGNNPRVNPRNIPQRQNFICDNCNRTGHTRSYCPLLRLKCYDCGQAGHTRRNCPYNNTQQNQTINYINQDYYYEDQYNDTYDDYEEVYYVNNYDQDYENDLYEAERMQK